MKSDRLEIAHVMRRAGFGATPAELDELTNEKTYEEIVDDLVNAITIFTGDLTESLDPVTCGATDVPLLGILADVLCTENESDEVASLLIPLEIQEEDLYLNFISLPIKEAPEVRR